jgi:hypothetical protein
MAVTYCLVAVPYEATRDSCVIRAPLNLSQELSEYSLVPNTHVEKDGGAWGRG